MWCSRTNQFELLIAIEHTYFEWELKAIKFEVVQEDRTCQLKMVLVAKFVKAELEEPRNYCQTFWEVFEYLQKSCSF